MIERQFPAGATPRVLISRVDGDVDVGVWDEDAIGVESDGTVGELYQEGDALVVQGCRGDLTLRVPARAELRIEQCRGDARVEGARRVSIDKVGGDTDLEAIAEEAEVGLLSGGLSVQGAPAVRGDQTISGDVRLERVERASFNEVRGDLHADEIVELGAAAVAGDLRAERLGERLGVGSVGGDLDVDGRGPLTLQLGNVGGDLDIDGEVASLQLGSVGGDLDIDGAVATMRAGSVGSDLDIDGRAGSVTLGSVGGDASLGAVGQLKASNVGSDLRIERLDERAEVGNVGGDAQVATAAGSVELGNVGGDLRLGLRELPAGATVRALVGGDAELRLPAEPNLTLSALVSGEVSGSGVGTSGGGMVRLVYGEGAASVDLTVGGDLAIGGRSGPQSSTSTSGSGFAGEFGRDMAGFGKDMAELGRELGRLGREIAQEISGAFAGGGAERGAAWADEVSRKVEEKARRVQEQVEERARRAEERARAHEAQARAHEERVRIKINDREWRVDPERLERIKEQARRATADGLFGAVEAVERALGRIGVPTPPTPPTPPAAPAAPAAPTAPAAPFTGQTVRIEAPEAPPRPAPSGAAPASAEQEREAILRMIAEGRISPEEGDLLLDALG